MDPEQSFARSLARAARDGPGRRAGATPAILGVGDALAAEYAAVLRRLGEPPRTLLHGDYRPDNMRCRQLAQREAAELVVYDWQFAAAGRGGYDLAYFLALSLPAEARRRDEARLLAEYCIAFRAHLADRP